ncbi:cupin [Altererythrobacter indicus]|uniref:Cupin n=1 Tax=Altericroceibacterium indicum TaxID=374177 RepID=A0A845AAU8_9SPHN|nr:cupin domain-containing protein [Altericroceibacterium indicum]MXP26814.1 cupin [Altericroceibacterium indicum]
MLLNDDITVPAVVHAAKQDWVASPTKGVDRRMLFRIGDEKARATSIVRYAPDSRFPHHAHPGGEEIFVLEGIFKDETGDFPAGSYIRNPPGSGHAPGSQNGCTIFVKLWQFRQDDQQRIVQRPGEGEQTNLSPGVCVSTVIFDNGHEQVRLEEWEPGAHLQLDNPDGLEMLILGGSFSNGYDAFGYQSWLRLPAGHRLNATVGPDGAKVWFKAGLLLQDNVVQF